MQDVRGNTVFFKKVVWPYTVSKKIYKQNAKWVSISLKLNLLHVRSCKIF